MRDVEVDLDDLQSLREARAILPDANSKVNTWNLSLFNNNAFLKPLLMT